MASQTGSALNSLSDPSQDFVVQDANEQILDLHALFEEAGHQTSLADAVHGLTSTGETVGLGKVGNDNLVTDTAQTPGDLVNGDSATMQVADLLTDAGDSVSAAGGILTGAGDNLANPDLVSDVTQGAAMLPGDLNDTGSLGDIAVPAGITDPSGVTDSLGPDLSNVSPALDAVPDISDLSGITPALATGGILTGAGDNLVNPSLVSDVVQGAAMLPGDLNDTGGLGGIAVPADVTDLSGVTDGLGPDLANVNPALDVAPDVSDLAAMTPALADVGNVADTGNVAGLVPSGASGEPLVLASAGDSGASPILDAGVLHDAPAGSPIDIAAGSGANLADLGALSGDTGAGGTGDSLVSAGAGADGSPQVLSAAALGGSNGDSPLDVAAGSGQNLAGIDALSGDSGGGGSGDSLVSAGAGNDGSPSVLSAHALGGTNGDAPVDVALGSGQNLVGADALSGDSGTGGSGASLVSTGAGDDGSPQVLSASALGGTNSAEPIDVAAGDAPNLADANVLNDDGSGHIVSSDAGASGGNPVLDTGVLTTPDAAAPVNADIANGTNAVNASLLSNSGALQFPNLGGTGTDTLTGAVPATPAMTDLAGFTGTGASTSDASLVDVNTYGAPLVQTHTDPASLAGVNNHALV